MPFMNRYRKREMARGSLINDIEKGKNLTCSDVRLNRTEIAKEIGPTKRSSTLIFQTYFLPTKKILERSEGFFLT
uniref:HTH psq-type domain-containing protein n=1 Tax=Heterorhabditis bacteriophora TaxID=37862 RepID=A0A1I7WVK5_HETBA